MRNWQNSTGKKFSLQYPQSLANSNLLPYYTKTKQQKLPQYTKTKETTQNLQVENESKGNLKVFLSDILISAKEYDTQYVYEF